jgi:hypothetical protein
MSSVATNSCSHWSTQPRADFLGKDKDDDDAESAGWKTKRPAFWDASVPNSRECFRVYHLSRRLVEEANQVEGRAGAQ